MPRRPERTAVQALSHMTFVRYSYHRTILRPARVNPASNEFASFEPKIRLLHRGILHLLNALNIEPDEFLRYGLRTNEESWLSPPETADAGFQEVRQILLQLGMILTRDQEQVLVLGYNAMFHGQLDDLPFTYIEVQQEVGESTDEDETEEAGTGIEYLFDSSDEEDTLVLPEGATDQQINALSVEIARNEDEGSMCSICIEEIVDGVEIRVLRCSHRFHKDCIDSWLKLNATCPYDRSFVCDPE